MSAREPDDVDRSDAATSGTPGGPGQIEQEPGRGQRAGADPTVERSDAEIRDEIGRWLASQNEIDASNLDVLAAARMVTLVGNVPDYETKRRIEDYVRNVHGVREVHDQLLVTRDPSTGIRP